MADIIGTEAGETLAGTADDDQITALGGDDVINAGAGNDTINPGLGKDAVNGEDGDDTIVLTDPAHFVFNGVSFDTDSYNGGDGIDTVEFRPMTSMGTVDYQFGPASGYSLFANSGIERLVLASSDTVDILVFTGTTLLAGITEVVGGSGRDVLTLVAGGVDTVFTIPSLTLTNWTSSPTPDLDGGDMVTLQAMVGDLTLNASEGLASTQGLLGGSGNETLVGSSGVDMLNGGGGTNTLLGNGGNDILAIVNAKDAMGNTTTYTGTGSTFDGGDGTDALSIGGSVTFLGSLTSIERIHLQSAWTSSLPNGSLSQTAAILAVSASAMATLPADLQLAGTGAIVVNLAPGGSYNAAGYGIAAGSSITHIVNGSTGDETVFGLQAADTLSGGAGLDTLSGGAGNDTLIGGDGDDALNGGTGDDIFYVDAGDVVNEAAGEGTDVVYALASYVLTGGAQVEYLSTILHTSTIPINLTGNELDNYLIGNAGSNFLVGGGGSDVLQGLGGNDDYLVDPTDLVIEEADGGLDTVYTNTSLVLGANLEGLEASIPGATDAIDLTGNELYNTIYGNAGANVLNGATGADVLIGFGGDDTYYVDLIQDVAYEDEGMGLDVVYASASYVLTGNSEVEYLSTILHGATDAIDLSGNEFDNYLIGNAGANVLDGAGGADVLQGLGGDDTYLVGPTDVVIEAADGGIDTVYTNFSLVLGANLEFLSALIHLSTIAIDLTGNELANTILGNDGANVLNGGSGADRVLGYGGNDTFYVDQASDQVFEGVDDGTDIIYSSASFVLAANIVVEVLSTISHAATDTINLTANEYANTLVGNAGSNTLNGGTGADALLGLGGNDVYLVDQAGDLVLEAAGGGSDLIYASASYALAAGTEVETLSTDLYAATTAIDLVGNEFGNTLIGNAGANLLGGGGAADILYGLEGGDTFAFDAALGAGNVDAVMDFVAGTDKFALDDAVFTGLVPGALPASAFILAGAAGDANYRVVYNPETGALFFDADGTGAAVAVQFATVVPGLGLAASDFMVV